MRINSTTAALQRCPWHRLLPSAVLFLAAILADCAAAAVPPEVVAAVRHNIETRYPGTQVVDVQPTPMAGVYELFDGEQIIYTDARGDYLLMGPLIDTQTHDNLTTMSWDQRDRIDFHSLPFALAIKVVKGTGRRVFAVFSDPDCPFCQQFDRSLRAVDDATMYVFLDPITALHPQAAERARAIWCSRNRSEAWELWMQDGAQPAAPGPCDNDPIEQLARLAAQLRINSTPTLILSDGRRIPGAVQAEELNALLNATGAANSASIQTSPSAN